MADASGRGSVDTDPTKPSHAPSADRLPVVFGWVSLLQDLGSKMVAPLVPLLLAGPLGAGPVVVGLVDALAEATASLSKALGGRLADRRRPLPLVRAGYLLSSLAKVLIGIATVWPAVLGLRLVDRVGKGVRDAPRDLMLANSTKRRGRSFGIQQAMDKTGGFLGPLIGAGAYALFDQRIRPIFWLALIPCLASVAVLFVAVGPNDEPQPQQGMSTKGDPLPTRVWPRLSVLAVHAAAALPAGLLILRSTAVGVGVGAVLVAYAANRAVVAELSYPAGLLADRSNPGVVAAGGMAVHAIALAVLASAATTPVAILGLLIAGAGDALTRAPAKAYVTGLVGGSQRGRVLGAHGAATGIASLLGALVAGMMWGSDGTVAMWSAAALALVAAAVQVGHGERSVSHQR